MADPLRLDDLVVTGTSDTMMTRKLPFSIGVVREEDLQQVPGVTALAALEGRLPGVTVMQATGDPGDAPAIRIRGHTSIYGSLAGPLLIVDGLITRGTLADFAANDIERIEVLKGAAATSYYGSDAANGVVQIFTRRGGSLADEKLRVTSRIEAGGSFVTKRWPISGAHWFQLDSRGQFLRTANGSRIPKNDLIADNPYPVSYDHQGQLLRSGAFLTQYVSLRQRKDHTSFAASDDYLGMGGVAATSGAGTDFAWLGTDNPGWPDGRGIYHNSNIGRIRHFDPGCYESVCSALTGPLYSAAMNDLLWAEGLIRGGGDASGRQARWKTRAALIPPKPNELLMMNSGSASRPVPGV